MDALIRSRIALMRDDERAADETYQRRLSECRACAELRGGTCAQCGCYVEMRAARQAMRCPHPTPKW